MNRLNFLSMNQEGEKVNEVNLDNLLQAMQQALEIEIASLKSCLLKSFMFWMMILKKSLTS